MEETRDKIPDPNEDSPGSEAVRESAARPAAGTSDHARSEAAGPQGSTPGGNRRGEAAATRPAVTATRPATTTNASAAKKPASGEPGAKQRGTGRWLVTLLALAALGASGYALFRVETQDAGAIRLQQDIASLRSDLEGNTATQGELRREIEQLSANQQAANEALRRRVESLQGLPDEVATLRAAVADVRSQTNLPRESARLIEARALLAMAEHRIAIDRDVSAATTALTTADRLLGEIGDPSLAAVRDRIAADLAALRDVPQPDRTALARRLAEAEHQVATLPLAVVAVGDSAAPADAGTPDSGPARAWAKIRQAFSDLITVRRNGDADALVSADLAAIRRQHLELLLLAARASLLRADQPAYESSLDRAQAWLERHFVRDATPVVAMRDELAALEQIDVAPALPDVSGSAELLARISVPVGDTE